ncbi:MAG: endolytic transglycosylase MltG [Eubacterium sp.]|nr:endolytic transglycosylase MltG [Eubacterium sp.]
MDKNTDKNQEEKRRRIGDAGRAREKREQRQAARLEAKAEKIAKAEQKAAVKAEKELKAVSKAKAKSVLKPKIKLKPLPKPKIEIKPVRKPKTKLKTESKQESKPKSLPKAEIKAAAKPEPKLSPKPEVKQEIKPTAKQEAKLALKTEIMSSPKPELKPVPKIKIKQPSGRVSGGNSFKTGCSVIFLIIFVFAFSFCIKTYTHYSHAKNGILNTDEEKGREEITAVIEIPEGASLKVISETLYEAGIIESPFFFRWKCNVEGISYNFNYGTFTVSSYMTFDELTECLMSVAEEGDYHRITVIEGDSIYDIAENVASFGVCTEEEFYEVCDSGEFDYEFIADIPERENRLEGYLFPDTYFIGYDMDAWDVVNMMLSNFNEKVYEGIYKSAITDYSLDDIVIIASIIEKEIKYDDERRIAASVIYNRLNSGMKLQMDATVLYALNEHKERVMEADTQVESEYNTYYVEGLPIGPIGNAGLNSFDGALNPADTDYIYYVLQNTETGQHYFTADYDDFLRAKEQYISGL